MKVLNEEASCVMGTTKPQRSPDPAARGGSVVVADLWSQPLTISDCEAESVGSPSMRPTAVSWLMPPTEPGCSPFVALWVRRAILSDSVVQEWVQQDLPMLLRMIGSGRPPENVEQVRHLIAAEFEAEGGEDVVRLLADEVAAVHSRELADGAPVANVSRQLPNGSWVTVPVGVFAVRSPVVTLVYPAEDDVASLSVLRDGALGRLATLADVLAEAYLVPVAEVVFCILTGLSPRLAPVRMGLRFRRFDVDEVPVTGTSRVVLEVDPQLDAGQLARTFGQWQRGVGVKPSKASPKLVPLGADLIGRLRLVPADRLADSPAHPAELFGIENKSWRLVPAVPWLRLAREVNYDPKLIRGRAAAVIHLLLPLDAPSIPRWLPRAGKAGGARGRGLRTRTANAR